MTKWSDSQAWRLLPYVGHTAQLRSEMETLCRMATRYARIQEKWASVEMDDAETARLERAEESLERRIVAAVDALPRPNHPSDDRWRVRFEGDPRGHTVALIAPDDVRIGLDSVLAWRG